MRFLGLVRGAENQGAPPAALMEAMQKFIAESLKDGSLVQTGGLAPSSQASRVRLTGGKLRTVDGPFAESKEVVGGYAIMEAPTKAGAEAHMRRFMKLHEDYWPEWEGESELREMVFVTP